MQITFSVLVSMSFHFDAPFSLWRLLKINVLYFLLNLFCTGTLMVGITSIYHGGALVP